MTKFQNLFLSILLLLSSCTPSKDVVVTNSATIIPGKSKITGAITTSDDKKKDSIKVTITVIHPILGENVKYEILADQSGKFSLNFDVELNKSLIGMYTSVNPYKVLYFQTVHNDSTYIDITYDSNNNIKNANVTPATNKYDMMQSMEILNKMIDYRSDDPNWEYPHLYNKSPDELLNIAKRTVSKRLAQFVEKDDLFSKEVRDRIAKDYRLFIYTNDVFNYEKFMKRNYINATGDSIGTPKLKKIDRTYFRFLKDFNLNDPQYLHTFTFGKLQDSILQNEILALPVIGDKDIPTWLTEVKTILSPLVGFDQGPYYDILAANAYGLQLREEARPLSEKQKENINHYWKNGEIAQILFRKNEEVVEYDKVKSPAVVHDISSVPKEKVIDEIISKYKNKVVFIDLWATWCGPCLDAMKQFNTVKGDFAGRDVVFVYLTNGSSPKKLWEAKIKGIGHDHYYLTAQQWEYLMNQFDFEYIPSYLLYNKEGKLIDKFSSFPGNDVVKVEIYKLLNN